MTIFGESKCAIYCVVCHRVNATSTLFHNGVTVGNKYNNYMKLNVVQCM